MRDIPFRFGAWEVDPKTNTIARGDVRRRLEPRAMGVLTALCERSGRIVSADELLQLCWGDTPYGDNPLHKTINQLRSVLGDRAKDSVFIETIRQRGYRTVAEVFQAEPELPAPPEIWTERSPFRGLLAFTEEHAAVFFGRNSAISQCVTAVISGVHAGYAMTLVLGASGSGKTSLIHAGVLPALQKGVTGDVLTRVVCSATLDFADVNGNAPLTVLASAMLDWQIEGRDLFPGMSSVILGARLLDDAAAVINELGAALDAGALANENHRLSIFIDRFEGFFADTRISQPERDSLLAVIHAFARSGRIIVILACRNDFYPCIVQHPELMKCKVHGGHFDLQPPTRLDLAHMIRGPSSAARLHFGIDAISGASLDDVLCESSTGNPDFLPLLQYTLQELYRSRTADGELTFAALQHMGGVDGAIGHRAEEIFRSLKENQRAALPRVLSLLVTLSESGDAVTSCSSTWSALHGNAEHELVSALVEARLFVAQLVGQERGFGVAHEALLRRWPRVTQWIETHRNTLQVRRRINSLTARWVAEGYSGDLLLPPGRQLDEARALVRTGVFQLSPDETKLIDRSSRSGRRRHFIKLTVIVLIACLAAAATVLGFREGVAKRAAQERRAEAEGLMEFMLGEFSNKLRPLARLDLLDSVSAKAMQYLSSSKSDEMTPASLTHRAKALQVIGEVHIARGKTPAAVEALTAAGDILRDQLTSEPLQRKVLADLGINAFWLGQLHLDAGDWGKAEKFFKEYRDYSDRVHALDAGDVDAWIEQSYAHSALGALASKRGDARGAVAEFRQSIDLKTRALARKPGDRPLVADLANSLSWAGSTQESLGDLEQAASLYAKELGLLSTLHQTMPGEALWTSRYANALQHQAGINLVRGHDQAALEDFRRAQQLYQSLLREQPDKVEWQGNAIAADLEQQRILIRHGDIGQVVAALGALSDRIAVLQRHAPENTRWIKLKAIADQSAASASLAAGRLRDSGIYLAGALGRFEQLHKKNGADIDTRKALAQTFLIASDWEMARGKVGAARAACAQARAVVDKDANSSTDFRLLDPWVKAQHCLGQSAAAKVAQHRLAEMGYRQTAYVSYLSRHHPGD